MNLTYFKGLTCLCASCSLNGVPFEGHIDVSELLGEHDVQGEVARHSHTIESAISLSASLYQKNIELQETIEQLNQTIVELVEKDYQLLTGEVL